MLFGGRAIEWPDNPRAWVLWLVLLVGIYVVWRTAIGLSGAILAAITALAGYAVEGELSIPPALLITGVVVIFWVNSSQRISARHALAEGLLIGGGFLAYELGRYWSEGSLLVAQHNAERVVELERRLGLAFESRLQGYVLRYDALIDLFNPIYSFLFIPFVLCSLFWLLATDDKTYRFLRTSLGLSAAISVIIFALFPVAPPRLMPHLGIADSHEIQGLQHGFVNEFAAVPSLHVGWMTLAAFALYRSLAPRYGRLLPVIVFLPPIVMTMTVIVTGNHYWIDGAVGALVSLAPALLLLNPPHVLRRTLKLSLSTVRRVPCALIALRHTIVESRWVQLSVISLGGLLSYLIVGQIVERGFTDYWGYIVAQIGATLIAILWLSHRLSKEGGLSWITHLIVVVVTYIDTFGTAAHMYDRFVTYDKIAHFGGGAAIAAATFDILFALDRRGAIAWTAAQRAFIATAVATVLGGCWEIYEFSADILFHTYRHAGQLDTIYDLISDATGGAVTGLLLLRREGAVQALETQGALDSGRTTQA